MEEINSEKQLRAAFASRNVAAFQQFTHQCTDFILMFDLAIECAEKYSKAWPLEKVKITHMMESSLTQMMVLCHNNLSNILKKRGRNPHQLRVSAEVIERLFNSKTAAKILSRWIFDGLTLGYLLWKCCPDISDASRFPRINNFIGSHMGLWWVNSATLARVRKDCNFFFHLIDLGIKRKYFLGETLLDNHYIQETYGEYTHAMLQYWRHTKPDATMKAVLILCKRVSGEALSKDMRKLLAQHIMREARAITAINLDEKKTLEDGFKSAHKNGHTALAQILWPAVKTQRKKAATAILGLGKHRESLFAKLPKPLNRQMAQMIVNPVLTMKAV